MSLPKRFKFLKDLSKVKGNKTMKIIRILNHHCEIIPTSDCSFGKPAPHRRAEVGCTHFLPLAGHGLLVLLVLLFVEVFVCLFWLGVFLCSLGCLKPPCIHQAGLKLGDPPAFGSGVHRSHSDHHRTVRVSAL